MGDESTLPPSEMELLRAEMRAGFQSIDGRLDGIDGRLDGHDQRFATLEARVSNEAADTRRHFDVVAEGLRADLKTVIDQTTGTGKKIDRLIASNAIEHAAFIEQFVDHEVRITALEKTTESPTSER